MTQTADLDLWNRALPLAKALRAYAPNDLLAELDAHPEKQWSSYYSFRGDMKNVEMTEMMTAATQKMTADRQARNEAELRVKRAVFGRYCKGELVLLGFEGPRQLNTLPFLIPKRMLNYLPDWENGTYTNEGLNLTQLRLLEVPEELRQLSGPKPVQLGRPGIGLQVQAAFKVLVAEGKINPEASALAHYPLLRQELQAGGDEEAMSRSDEGLRAHFSGVVAELTSET